MKKIIALCLSVVMILTVCTAFAGEWKCPNCGRMNTGNFCPDCGTQNTMWICPNCGCENSGAFCENCGTAEPVDNSALMGTWKFTAPGETVYLTFTSNTEFIACASGSSRAEGSYIVSGDSLALSINGIPFTAGTFHSAGDKMTLEALGTGERTDEAPRFTIQMEGQSMADTIRDGDKLIVTCPDLSEYNRFDIVVVKYPDRDPLFIKRLIGFSGDVIELRDGYLYINGEKYDEPYVSDDYRTGKLNTFGPFTVPESSYFVLGDHRNNSNDSRSSGPIPADRMIGIAAFPPFEDDMPVTESVEFTQELLKQYYPLLYKEEIEKYAVENGLDPALVISIILAESSFRADAESASGARGLMQLPPKLAQWIAEQIGETSYSFDNLFDPETNIRFGCWYLRYLKNVFSNDVVCMVAAFYTGNAQVKKWLSDSSISSDGKTLSVEKLPEGTAKKYIQNVMNNLKMYQEIYPWP